ncbi:hypothetical protein BT63DRAFT_450778 [Microthyrium microscopicum]|uniref:Uncharacterized protein n=1 Tax=Microthyrium microscopicum TaxID=703497 RepID=A0A6A6UKK6_9PEZI|nr:hypothetical protein BT63DRAFT_450778 [Microthyrium microscopicum]
MKPTTPLTTLPLLTTAQTCLPQSPTTPTLNYTISPQFIWFPSHLSATNLTTIFTSALQSAPPPASMHPYTLSIPNFLSTPCTTALRIFVGSTTPLQSPQFAIELLNHTLSSTDLICRLATHKLGTTLTDAPHTMLSSHVHALVRAGSAVPLGKGAADQVVSVEYSITCPKSATGEVVKGEQAAEVLEGLKGLAAVRDCEWCERIRGQLMGMCSAKGNGEMEALVGFMGERKWSLGDVQCEPCAG